MVFRNLEPDAVANVHAGDVDALGGNVDQPDMQLDQQGKLAAPADAAEFSDPAPGSWAAGADDKSPAKEDKSPAKKAGGKAAP